MQKIIKIYILLLLLGWCYTAFAGDVSKNATWHKDILSLGTVIVSAPKMKKVIPGDVHLSSSPVFFSVIKRPEFEGKIESLADVLKTQTGVQIRQFGGVGSYSTVSIRGSESQQVMVFLDGVLLNTAAGGGVDLSTISLSDVESIQVFKGITPVNFGKASIGGVVNIITRRTEKGFKGNITLGYGSFDTKKASLFINHKPGKFDYIISADSLTSKNNFKFINDMGTKFNTADDREEERHNDAVRSNNILTKAGYDFSSNFRTELMNEWFSKHQQLPDWRNSIFADTTYDINRNITNLGFILKNHPVEGINFHLNFKRLWIWEQYDDSNGWIGLGKQKNRYITERYSTDLYGEWIGENNILSSDVEYFKETYKTKYLLQPQNPRDSYRRYLSLALQDSLFLFNERLIITPGGRYTWIKDHLNSGTSIFGLPLPSKTREEDYLQPQIGIKYRPFSWLSLKTNWAKYVREPTFFELFGDRGFFIGNDDLKAEKGENFDIGVILKKKFDLWWLNTFRLELCYFKTNITDLITKTFDARGVGKFVNISSAKIKGTETEINFSFLKYLNWTTRMTIQDTKNENPNPTFYGKELPGRFKYTYYNRLDFRIKKIKFYVERLIQKNMYYDTANLLPADTKDETNAGISILYRKFLLTLTLNNIEDNHYQDFNGYPMPGRSFFVTLQYRF